MPAAPGSVTGLPPFRLRPDDGGVSRNDDGHRDEINCDWTDSPPVSRACRPRSISYRGGADVRGLRAKFHGRCCQRRHEAGRQRHDPVSKQRGNARRQRQLLSTRPGPLVQSGKLWTQFGHLRMVVGPRCEVPSSNPPQHHHGSDSPGTIAGNAPPRARRCAPRVERHRTCTWGASASHSVLLQEALLPKASDGYGEATAASDHVSVDFREEGRFVAAISWQLSRSPGQSGSAAPQRRRHVGVRVGRSLDGALAPCWRTPRRPCSRSTTTGPGSWIACPPGMARTCRVSSVAPGRSSRTMPGEPPSTSTHLESDGSRAALVGKRGSVRELVKIAATHGFYSGGFFRSRPDGMHFEAAKVLSRSKSPRRAEDCPL